MNQYCSKQLQIFRLAEIDMDINSQPIIIIGAGRSGTNMLRDALTQLPELGTWPCDEINYIWRHGNTRFPTDEFEAHHATVPVKRYIQQTFTKIAQQQSISHVVEKTCANSLRVSYVNEIFPNAKFIFIVRDGRDVVSSAVKRWSASLDIPYILKKARYVPLSDLPYYALRYFANRLYRLTSDEKRLASWGPRFAGMDEMLSSSTIAEVSAAQWKRCIDRSEDSFAQMLPERVYRIQYETFVCAPKQEFKKLCDFLQIDVETDRIESIVQNISSASVGKWKQDLPSESIELIQPILMPLLENYGYTKLIK